MADEYDRCDLCDVGFKTKQESIFHYRSFGHSNKVLEQESKGEDANTAQSSVEPEESLEIPANGSAETETDTPEVVFVKSSSPLQSVTTTANGSSSKPSEPVPLMSMAGNDSDAFMSGYDDASASKEPSSEPSNGASASDTQGSSAYLIPDTMMSEMMSAWGRKNEFYCEVCDMDCKSSDPYRKHLLGSKHKKKAASKANFHTGGGDQTMDLEMQLTTLGEPILGLECVQELVVSAGEMLYKCFLCGIASLTANTIGPHLICYKHRKAYMAFKYPQMFKQLKNKSKKESQEMVESAALKIEESYGREHIVRAEEKMSAQVLEGLKNTHLDQDVNDLGVNQLDDSRFYCEVCDIATTSAGALAIHCAGSKHQKKAQNALRTGGNFESVTDGLEQNLSDTAPGEAMIGLEFISEHHFVDASHDEIRYVCHLCDINTLTVDAFSNHVISVRHRRRFMKICFPDKHTIIVKAGSKNAQQKLPAKRLAKEVETLCGRRKIVRMFEIVNGVFPPHIVRLEQRKLELDMDKSDNVLSSNSGPKGVPPAAVDGLLGPPPFQGTRAPFQGAAPSFHGAPPPFQSAPSPFLTGPPPFQSAPVPSRGAPPPKDPHNPLFREREKEPPRRRRSPDDAYRRRSRSPRDRYTERYRGRSRSPDDRYRRRSRSPYDRYERRRSPNSPRRDDPYERKESDRESERLRQERDEARKELEMLRSMVGKDGKEGSGAPRDGVSMVSNVETKIYTAPNQQSVFERKIREYRTMPTSMSNSSSLPNMSLPPPSLPSSASSGGVPSGLPPVVMPTGPPPAAPPAIFASQTSTTAYSSRNAAPSSPDTPKKEDYESVVPPLQSMEAFCDPAVKDGNPFTSAPRILNTMAEIMFLIKISPFPTYRFRDIAIDAFKQEDLKYSFSMNPVTASSTNHELLLTLEGIQIAKGTAAIVEVAQTQAFQIFVEKARESDYLLIEEGRSGPPTLRMFRSIIAAPSGAFRYDLLCKPRTRLSSELPVCEFCTAKGHIQHFCLAKKGL